MNFVCFCGTGIGPAPAIRRLCEKTGIALKDVDLIDVNEAFASQFCAVEKDLQLDPAKTNVNGGAVAIGHRKEESTVLSFIDLIVFLVL